MVRVHVIIVGCGRVGSGLAIGLVEQDYSVAVIDRSAKAFRRLPADWPGEIVVGSGFDRDDLDKAGAGHAQALAAVSSGDNSNILTARIARETYEIPNVVARIYDPRRAQIYLRLGIPTVATVSWTIDQVCRRLIPGVDDVEWTDPTGTLSLMEHQLPERWAGKRLTDLNVTGEITLVSVTRAGVARLDLNELVGQEGDIVHMIVSDTAKQHVIERFGATAPLRKDGNPVTVIAGIPVPDTDLEAGAR
jgi:trk system potassium uptake protein